MSTCWLKNNIWLLWTRPHADMWNDRFMTSHSILMNNSFVITVWLKVAHGNLGVILSMDTLFESIITSHTPVSTSAGICIWSNSHRLTKNRFNFAWGIVKVLQSHVVWNSWALGKQEVSGKGAGGLDRFAQPCEFHFTSLKRSLLCYETSWRALKRIPAHGRLSFMGGGAGVTERERAADIISPILSPPVCLQWPPPTSGCAKELWMSA